MALIEASSAEVLHAVMEASQDAVLICDAEGRIATWSDTSARLFDEQEEGVVGRPFASLFAEHLRDEVAFLVVRALAGERACAVDSELVRHDGLPVPVSISFCPVVGPGGSPSAMVAVVRDVTEQRLAQAALAEAEVMLREGEALAHVGSWMWDVRTDVVQWSAEFHHIHDVDPLDFGGTLESYLSAVASEDRERMRKAMQSALTDGRPFEMEYATVGGRRVLVRAQPAIGSDGKVVGLRGVGRLVQS
jgi:PAS domain S-box-containing protein